MKIEGSNGCHGCHPFDLTGKIWSPSMVVMVDMVVTNNSL